MVAKEYHRFSISEYKGSIEEFSILKRNEKCRAEKIHSHDFIQIYYVNRGVLKHFVDGNEVLLTHGDMFIIPPETYHKILRLDNQTEFTSISFYPAFLNYNPYGESYIERFITFLMVDSAAGKKLNIRPKLEIKAEHHVQIWDDIISMIKEFEYRNEGYKDILTGTLRRILVLIAREYFSTPYYRNNASKYNAYSSSILKSIEYISENYRMDLKINETAEKFYISRTYFCKLFKQYTGMSFNRYVNYKRITEAQRILKSCTSSIKKAAYDVGYKDLSSFYRHFGEITGTTPGKYMQIHHGCNN